MLHSDYLLTCTLASLKPEHLGIVFQMLTKRQHDQQEAIWELLNTELHYIKALRVIVDVSPQITASSTKFGPFFFYHDVDSERQLVIKVYSFDPVMDCTGLSIQA